MATSVRTGYAPVAGVDVYWESRGSGGVPLIVVPGGYGLTSLFSGLLDRLASDRQVVAIELQGHGHTRDTTQPLSFESFGDQVAGVVDHLELRQADLLGYSLGASAGLRCAIQHPDKVRRQMLVSIPVRHSAWFPEVLAAFDQMSSAGFEQMQYAPLYDAWLTVAPDPDAFPTLMDKMGQLLWRPYDWSDDVAVLTTPTLLVYGDADSIPPSHAAEFFALLGGGLRDAGWTDAQLGRSRLAIVPGRTHYDMFEAPQLPAMVSAFLS
jgi:pimeloyl-ACP methyl ester carboxylesterase